MEVPAAPIALSASSQDGVWADPNFIVDPSSEMDTKKWKTGKGDRVHQSADQATPSRGEPYVLTLEGDNLILGPRGDEPRHAIRLKTGTRN
jgi:hypothetical protein